MRSLTVFLKEIDVMPSETNLTTHPEVDHNTKNYSEIANSSSGDLRDFSASR